MHLQSQQERQCGGGNNISYTIAIGVREESTKGARPGVSGQTRTWALSHSELPEDAHKFVVFWH